MFEDELFRCDNRGKIFQKSDNVLIAYISLKVDGLQRMSLFKDLLFDPNCSNNILIQETELVSTPGSYRICRRIEIFFLQQTYPIAVQFTNQNPRLLNFLSKKLCVQNITAPYFLIDSVTLKHSLYETPEMKQE